MRNIIAIALVAMFIAGIGIIYAAKPPSWDAISMYTLKRAHSFSSTERFLLTGSGYKENYVYTVRFEGPSSFDKSRLSEGDFFYLWVNCGGSYSCLPERSVSLGIGTWIVSVWDGTAKVARLRMVIK